VIVNHGELWLRPGLAAHMSRSQKGMELSQSFLACAFNLSLMIMSIVNAYLSDFRLSCDESILNDESDQVAARVQNGLMFKAERRCASVSQL
jgi:hypothetical protein